MFHSTSYAEEFAVKKRAVDVALKGFSDVKQPKRKSGAFSIRKSSFKSNAKSSVQLITKTLDEKRHLLEGLDESIHTEVILVKSLLAEHCDSSTAKIPDTLKPEILNTMRFIKGYQKEYVRVLRVMEGIKVIEVAMHDGFLDPRKVATSLNEIHKIASRWQWRIRRHDKLHNFSSICIQLIDRLVME